MAAAVAAVPVPADAAEETALTLAAKCVLCVVEFMSSCCLPKPCQCMLHLRASACMSLSNSSASYMYDCAPRSCIFMYARTVVRVKSQVCGLECASAGPCRGCPTGKPLSVVWVQCALLPVLGNGIGASHCTAVS